MKYQWSIVTTLLVLSMVGCGEPTVKVSGTVTYKGEPLGGATVTFFPSNNNTFLTDTKPDGTYSVPVTGTGTIRVTVQIPPPRPKPRAAPPTSHKAKLTKDITRDDDRAKMSRMPPPSEMPTLRKIPAKYNDINSSGLSFELTGDNIQFDIKLE